MVTASVSRGATTVDFEVWGSPGDLAIGFDVGKPNQSIISVSRLEPRSANHQSDVQRVVVLGVLKGPGAYSAADALAEDLIKPHSGGTPLQLDLTDVTGIDSVFTIGVPDSSALELSYLPGRKNVVDLSLNVPLVSDTIG